MPLSVVHQTHGAHYGILSTLSVIYHYLFCCCSFPFTLVQCLIRTHHICPQSRWNHSSLKISLFSSKFSFFRHHVHTHRPFLDFRRPDWKRSSLCFGFRFCYIAYFSTDTSKGGKWNSQKNPIEIMRFFRLLHSLFSVSATIFSIIRIVLWRVLALTRLWSGWLSQHWIPQIHWRYSMQTNCSHSDNWRVIVINRCCHRIALFCAVTRSPEHIAECLFFALL